MQGQGYKIKQLREKLILTQKEMAKLLGVSRQTISMWENDRWDIKDENLQKILKLK